MNLCCCCTAGPISESVSSLRLLQELALHNNQLSGASVNCLLLQYCLCMLIWIPMCLWMHAGAIPDGIGSLKALSTLQLHHNELTGKAVCLCV